MKMKIKLLLFFIMICSGISYAQIVKNIGIKSGITFSNQYWEKTQISTFFMFETSAAMYEAITLDFIDKQYWELSSDFGCYQSGVKTKLNPFINYNPPELHMTEDKFKYGFISISPVIKFKIPVNSFTPYILLAPRMDYYYSALGDKVNNESDVIKPIWGFTVGEGVEYRKENISIFAEYQFMYCFNNFIEQIVSYPFNNETETIKINTHVISLGVKYHFTKK
ncbi:MAG: outer membrane protein [Bacteroidales bacterium]